MSAGEGIAITLGVPEEDRVVELAERPREHAGADQQPGEPLPAAR